MRPKLYISVSNQADKSLVDRVLLALSTRNVEVVMLHEPFSGHDKMLECDHLLFIPPTLVNIDIYACEVVVGKGQYEQLTAWEAENKRRPWMLHTDSKHQLLFGDITSWDDEVEVAKTDFVNHASVYFDDDRYEFDHHFQEGPSIISTCTSYFSSSLLLVAASEMGLI